MGHYSRVRYDIIFFHVSVEVVSTAVKMNNNSSQTLDEGHFLILKCDVTSSAGHHTSRLIKWVHENDGTRKYIKENSSKELVIKAVTKRHNGNYTCVVDNHKIQINKPFNLKVRCEYKF